MSCELDSCEAATWSTVLVVVHGLSPSSVWGLSGRPKEGWPRGQAGWGPCCSPGHWATVAWWPSKRWLAQGSSQPPSQHTDTSRASSERSLEREQKRQQRVRGWREEGWGPGHWRVTDGLGLGCSRKRIGFCSQPLAGTPGRRGHGPQEPRDRPPCPS